MLEEIRPTWLEINLDNLAHNIVEVRRIVKNTSIVMAVVKANAYGHGSIQASKVFLENGADRLAVATLSEASELRSAGIKVPILILGYTPANQYHMVVKNNINPSVYNLDHGKMLSKTATSLDCNVKIHVKLDTGLGRIGFSPSEKSVRDIVTMSKLPSIEIEGIFTHFAVADIKEKEYTRKQYEKFQYVVEKLEKQGVCVPIKHVSNSAAIIDLPEYNLDMVRPGGVLYGLNPLEYSEKPRIDLRKAMTFKTKLSNVKDVPKGTGISYGLTFITDRQSRIGSLPLGYADGYSRSLSNNAEVLIKDKRAPVVGRICMDQCMVDLTGIPNTKIGDEVVLFGDGRNNTPRVEDVALWMGSNVDEVVCLVSRRVPRVYIQKGEVVEIRDYLEHKQL